MKKTFIATTIVAMLSATALPAVAQNSDYDSAYDVLDLDVPEVDVEADIGAGAAVEDSIVPLDANANTAVAASEGVDLTQVDPSQVNIVLASSADPALINQAAALDSNAGLVAAVDSSPAVQSQLDAAGFTTGDVVALTADANGSVFVIVDDLA